MARPPLNGHVTRAERCQAVGIVFANVFFVADADRSQVQQRDQAGQHACARQVSAAKIARHLATENWQKPFAGLEPQEFGLVRNLAPLLVVDVLFAAAGIAAGGLQMPVGLAADPDVRPRRRNCERLDAIDMTSIPQPASVAVQILEARAVHMASEAGLVVYDIFQVGEAGQLFRRGCIYE